MICVCTPQMSALHEFCATTKDYCPPGPPGPPGKLKFVLSHCPRTPLMWTADIAVCSNTSRAVSDNRLNQGSPNFAQTMILRHPDLGMILVPKGERSHGSNVSDFAVCAFSVTALLTFTRWHDHILLTTRPISVLDFGATYLLAKHCCG